MINLIYADLFKMRKSTAMKICFLMTCICAASIAYISHGIAIGSIKADVSSDASGLSDIVMMGLFGSLMAGILVCSDFESKLIHDAIASGKGRITVVISKTIVYVLVIALLLLPYAVTALIGFCSGAEFTKPFVPSVILVILANEEGLSVTISTVGKIIVLTLISMLTYAARLSFCLPLAFKVRKPAVVMGIGMTVGYLIDLVIRSFNDVPVLGDILSYTPYCKGLYDLTFETGAGTLLEIVASCIVFLAVMTAITHLIFRRAEIR